jgi:hypothetical protein
MMRALLILAVGLGVGWWWATTHRESAPVATAEQTLISTAPPAVMPAATPAADTSISVGPELSDDERIPLSFRQEAMRRGTPAKGLAEQFYAALAKSKPMRLFKGNVLQHLHDGNLLVEVWTVKPGEECVPRGIVSIFGYPNAHLIADDVEIDCMVYPVGTYQYTTVDGATRTVYEMIYMPKGFGGNVAKSTPKPTPTSVTWSPFPPGVDTPEQRRAHLQRLAKEKRQREANAR